MDWLQDISALGPMMALAILAWILSLITRNVGLIDSFWSLFFLSALGVWWSSLEVPSARAFLLSALLIVWGLRLSAYLTYRNWGKPEDRRYAAIRARNQPHYAFKSLIYVFALQVVLAWIIAQPILPTLGSKAPLNSLDIAGCLLFLTGFLFETIADFQMLVFKADPTHGDRVMNRGLWRYSRHPNYFGEALLWWGIYLIAVGGEAPFWVIISPLFMSFLLLRVSGVPMLEDDLKHRKPEYRAYIETTSSFWPKPPRRS